MGKGPPYARRDPVDGDGRTNDIWSNPRRLDVALADARMNETRLVVRRGDLSFYALGLMGVEEDLETLDLR